MARINTIRKYCREGKKPSKKKNLQVRYIPSIITRTLNNVSSYSHRPAYNATARTCFNYARSLHPNSSTESGQKYPKLLYR
eukprot:c29700_g1_i1 orf=734-976(+)